MMKFIPWMMSIAVVAMGWAHAQERTRDAAIKVDDGKSASQKMLMPTSKLIGTTVKDLDGENCGDINAFVFDIKGQVHYVLIGLGGVVGVGESEVAVPWSAFHCECTMENEKMVCHPKLKMSSKQLQTAPHLKAQGYLELTDSEWSKNNATFFRTTPMPSPLAKTDMSSKVIDTKVMGTGKEAVGQLDELMIQNGSGEIPFAVLGRGGVAGVGESYVAVSFPSLQFIVDDKDFKIQYRGKEGEIDKAIKVTPSEYPELRLGSVANQVKRGESR
ncbi:MAG: PRC-barrel domain-containing protein [Pirellulales bacterium]